MASGTTALARLLEGFRLVVVTGKGGTGKSTLSAALATVLARAGRRTWLLEADPRESLHAYFELPPSGGRPVVAGPHLVLQNISPVQILDHTVKAKLRVGLLARRVLESPVYRTFVEAAPGLKETAVLGRAYRLLRGKETMGKPAPEIVVLDAAATGHGLAALTAPSALARTLGSGPVGRMAAAVASLVEDPGATAVVAVSTAEEMPVTETLELAEGCRKSLGRPPLAAILNRLLPADTDPAGCGLDPKATRLWKRRLALQAREIQRLEELWDGPLFQVPLVPEPPGNQLRIELARALEGGTP